MPSTGGISPGRWVAVVCKIIITVVCAVAIVECPIIHLAPLVGMRGIALVIRIMITMGADLVRVVIHRGISLLNLVMVTPVSSAVRE